MGRDYYQVGTYSVSSSEARVVSCLGHCFEPSPTGLPVVVLVDGEEMDESLRVGTQVFWYPDHVAEINAMLGTSVVASGENTAREPLVISPPPPGAPPSVTATQIRVWLVRHGVSSEAIDSIIEAIPDDATRNEARVRWEYSPYIERNHPLVGFVGNALGLDSAAMDAAFIDASNL